MNPKKLFISYSHADAALLQTLKTHLKPLERVGTIAPWFDGYLLPGDDIDFRVRSALQGAELIALLISPDFLASDYCYEVEMETAVARDERGEARVIPIIARECQWHSAPFGRLLAVPTDGKPIMSMQWPDKDAAWTIVAKGIEAAAKSPVASPASSQGEASPASINAPRSSRPMPVVSPKRVTDRDRDEFKQSAFDHIARRFDDSLAALAGDLSGSLRRIDANRFTATIYRSGSKVAACTVWIGGGSWGANSICYVGNDSGETNSMNESLSVEDRDGDLGLKPQFASVHGRSAGMLDADQAAEHLWAEFVRRLKHN
ncbi:MAG: toll/interleukin-1 receptor domain-containing protein [Hyphomonadaceae bacterium]|nr:toll/interleukin-1 receptor domain-containing protein [Hyphomonadaceae bacterium]